MLRGHGDLLGCDVLMMVCVDMVVAGCGSSRWCLVVASSSHIDDGGDGKF